ncbi:hypothetical protein ACR79M_08335 [Sphingobacterium spiritivorum]|uniref:hypothetical protein n=1 Tax=Sphingobacterium spiritivorum TaxID=258 RepID=UPI003DA1DE01
MKENEDYIGNRVNDLGKIYKWIKENPMAFLCTVMTIIAFIFIWLFIDSKNENIRITQQMSKQITDEVRRQVPISVREQLQPIKDSVDNTKSNIDKLIERVTQ